MLTHPEMVAVIRAGGSVAHSGRIITRVEDLPTPAELAVGDPVAEVEARDDLQRQIDALQAQLALLGGVPASDLNELDRSAADGAGETKTKK